MDTNQTEKKYTSKIHRFFDLVYRLLVVNLFTIITSIPILTFFPAIVACTATLKNNMNDTGILKPYFKNFAKYFWKSFKMGIVLLLIIAISGYSFFFWIFQDFETDKMDLVAQVGIAVMVICLLVFLFSTVHLPFMMISIVDISNFQRFKMSVYVAFRYILTTLILIVTNLLIISPILLAFFQIIRYGFIGIWMMIGISLPLFIAIKVTTPIYYKIEKIDFKKISQQVEEDLNNEK